MPDREWVVHLVGARRCLARPRRMARRFNLADTSRTTRSADQPSARLRDRPAVNGRAQSPSRLKPADPNGACTTPIDPGALQPPSGGLRTEPGASAPGVRCRPPRQRGSRHHRTLRRRSAAPAGPAGPAAPDPYQTGISPHRGGRVPHLRHPPDQVGAGRCLTRAVLATVRRQPAVGGRWSGGTPLRDE